MRILRAITAAGVLALLGLLVWSVAHRHGPGVAVAVDKGETVLAPKLDLPRLDAPGRLSLASLRGKVVVVNFWQSSCLPCKQEAKVLASAASYWQRRGVVFVGVDSLDLKSTGRAYMKRYEVNYPNVRDALGSTYPNWGVTGTPETFFIDRRGRVVPPHIIGQASRQDLDQGIRHALRS
jgi:cytochrome c biogenesis protein CcmG, thiol:disulfide interchange protein DsbE